jgi:hypothetical protein
VRDIMTATSAPEHKLTKFARVEGERITYPPEQGEQGELF